MLLTGDNSRAALAVAAQLGIPASDVFAEVRPEGKVEAIRRLQADGIAVCFVGDGVHHAAHLAAQADLGMAIGALGGERMRRPGAADLTLVGGDPATAAEAIQLARATVAVIRGNLAGPPATTCSRSRSPPSATSTPCSPGSPWPPARSSWSATACA